MLAFSWKLEIGRVRGQPGKACPTSSYILKYLFQKLNEHASKDKEIYKKYSITLEATHHGPLIDIPSCFIELGSGESEWGDEKAAKILARTIMSLEKFEKNNNWIPCIAVGGTHYCPNFNKIQVNSNYAISHIIPKYSFPITETIIKEAERKTIETIKRVLIDWKSCNSEERNSLLNILNKLGLKYEKTSNVEK